MKVKVTVVAALIIIVKEIPDICFFSIVNKEHISLYLQRSEETIKSLFESTQCVSTHLHQLCFIEAQL